MGARALSQHEDYEPRAVGVVAALPIEAEGLAGRLDPGASAPLPGGGRLQLGGLGSSNARRAAIALADGGVGALLSWGSAGGLDPRLQTGDLIVPETVVGPRGERFAVAIPWRKQVLGRVSLRLQAYAGALVQSPSPVTTPERKLDLFNQTGAVAVDMESAAVAEIARSHGLPFLAIRAVLDPASRALPRSALAAVDGGGRLRPRQLLHGMLCRPFDLVAIAQLMWDMRAVCATLAAVAELTELGCDPRTRN